MKYSEVEKKLKAAGCYWLEDGKRHPLWYSPTTNKKVALSYHRGQEVKNGTLKSISRDMGVKL